MAVDKTYTIEDVWIVLTYPDDVEENFKLEAPNGDNAFEFGFRKIPKLEDYRDANMKWQRGCYYYQLFVRYQYQSHEMDLRKLLIADNIALKFPPAFGQPENHNQADCLLANESVVKNYIAGLAMAGDSGEVVPSGDLTLEFEGIDAFTEAQLFSNFGWNQSDVADPDDEDDGDGGPDLEFSDNLIYYVYNGGSSDREVRKATADEENGIVTEATYVLPDTISLGESAVHVMRSGNVLVTAMRGFSGGGTFRMWLLDADLNELETKSISLNGSNSASYAYIDHDDSVYITIKTGSKDLHVRKYSPDLGTLIWESPAPTGTNPSSRFHVSGNVTKNYVAVHMSSFTGDNDVVFFYNKSTGAIEKTDGRSYRTGSVNAGATRNFEDGKFIIGTVKGSTSSGDNNVYLYDEDANLLSSTELLDVDIGGGRTFDVIDETTFVVKKRSDRSIKHYNISYTLIWNSSNLLASGDILKSGRTTDANIIFVSGDSDSLTKVDLTNQTLTDVYKTGATLENQAAARAFGMKFENWQVQAPDSDEPPPPPDPNVYEGSIEVTSAADANFEGVAPETYVLIRNSPSTASDECGTGGTEFNIEYKLTDYCTVLPVASPENLALQIAQFIDANIPGLNAFNGTGYDGDPAVFIQSETKGLDDEGEGIIFGVPSSLEQDGPVFNRYTVYLFGGEAPSSIDTAINIRLGKTVFATTENITGSETAASISQKIYDACVAVDQDDVEFSKDGNKITVTSTGFKLAISLDIFDTGFDHIITQMEEI